MLAAYKRHPGPRCRTPTTATGVLPVTPTDLLPTPALRVMADVLDLTVDATAAIGLLAAGAIVRTIGPPAGRHLHLVDPPAVGSSGHREFQDTREPRAGAGARSRP